MSNYLQGNSYHWLGWGPQVMKTSVANQTSATGTSNLFTV